MNEKYGSADSSEQISVVLFDRGSSQHELRQPLEDAASIDVVAVRSVDELVNEIDRNRVDCVVSRHGDPSEALAEIRAHQPDLPCLLVGDVTDRCASDSAPNRVTDYLSEDLLIENDDVLVERIETVAGSSLIANGGWREDSGAVVDVIGDPAFVSDERGTVERVNDAFESGFDLGGHVICGEPVGELWKYGPFSDEDATAIESAIRSIRDSADATKTIDVRLSGEDRTYRTCSVAPLLTTGGERRTVCVFEDGFDRREFHDRLDAVQQAHELLSDADDKTEVCSIAVRTASKLLDMPLGGSWLYDDENRHLQPVAGTSAVHEQLGGLPHIWEGEGLAWNVFVDGELAVYEDVRTKEGLYNPNTIVESEIILPLGDVGLLIVGALTERTFTREDVRLAALHAKNVESALVRADRERQLATTRERLERQNDRLSDFATIVSHDLRNPMNVANGHLSLARQGNSDAIDTVEESLERMNEIIEDVLDLTRKGQLVTEPSDVAIEHVIKTAWQRVETEESTLRTGRLPVVKADPVRVVRILENLFENAIEHAGPDVTVTVSEFDITGDSVTTTLPQPTGIYVEDDGPGFPDESTERLFESGFTTMSDGFGLGLAVVREIAEAHGWEVRATEGNDGGARIEIVGLTPVDPRD